MEARPMLVQHDLSSSAARMAIFWGPGVLLLVLTALSLPKTLKALKSLVIYFGRP